MMKKKALCLLLCLCCATGLSGCTGRKDSGTDEAPATLPPAAVSYKAPDGEFMPGRGENFNLYLPGKDGLTPVPVTLESMPLNETLRALVEELLRYEGSGSIRGLGDTAEGRIELTLYGENPVEFSSGVCKVNLGPSARQLKHQEFYTAALSLAATLCELDEIRWVNVLVADMSVGLDITGNQAMGSVSSHLDENLTVLWEQMVRADVLYDSLFPADGRARHRLREQEPDLQRADTRADDPGDPGRHERREQFPFRRSADAGHPERSAAV